MLCDILSSYFYFGTSLTIDNGVNNMIYFTYIMEKYCLVQTEHLHKENYHENYSRT